MKHILLTTALVAFATAPGFANTHDTENGGAAEIENGAMESETQADIEPEADTEMHSDATILVTELSSDDLIGAQVVSGDGENVNVVRDALLDDDGAIEALLFGVGGFLGIGARTVAVGVDEIEIVEVDGELEVHLDMSEEEIRELPEYEDE